MKKYTCAFAILLALSLFVTCQREKYTHEQETRATEQSKPPIASEMKLQSETNSNNHIEYPPTWKAKVLYRVFSFPEGITVWALFLTMLVIAEQTLETRLAAKASLEQVFMARELKVLQFRPRVRLRKISLDETDNNLNLEITVANVGEGTATVVGGSVEINWKWGHSRNDTHESTTVYEPFTLEPGEDAPLTTDMRDGWLLYRMGVNYADDGKPEALTFRCSGELQYVDQNGTKRRTGFWRVWDHREMQFLADARTDREYSD